MAILAQDFDLICTMVKERSAIVLEPGKEYLVESRLMPIASAHGLRDLHQLAAALRAAPNGPLMADVVDAMTTNETSFFRDIRPFEALRTTIVPELIRSRSAERSLTIWCGACSTGQEPYSVAMTLTEHFPELAGWQVRIIATDLSPTVVKQAERGAYTQLQVNRGMPAPLLVKYFERKGMEFHVKPEIRRRVEFRTANLVAQWPAMPTVDLVLLRNVLIYFDNAAREQILRRAHSIMAPHGHLLLGSTESTIGLDVPFRREQAGAVSSLRPAASGAGTARRSAAFVSPSPAGIAGTPRPTGANPVALAGPRPQPTQFTYTRETRS